MKSKELTFFKVFFITASLWNLIGAFFGYFNTAYTFKGTWGTTLVYFIGYAIVAYNPLKHYGIVIVGGIGKVGFSISLFKLYLSGLANSVVFIVIIGDLIFSLFFVYYFFRLYDVNKKIINQ